jgi:hypothetical protein
VVVAGGVWGAGVDGGVSGAVVADVIVTGTNPVVTAFKTVTSTIPVVAFMAELSVQKGLPTMCPYRDHVEAGALMGYAVDLAELLRRMADDVHQILKGAKPGDIPIYQPTKFELLINLKTAKALGLTLSQALLAQAAEIIE